MLAVWIVLSLFVGFLYYIDIIDPGFLILLSLALSVLDIICIVFFCPFQSWILKNRCCTTCRIYNWDFAMMFTPLWVAPGLLNYYLVGLSLIVFFHWEINHHRHPERFYENTNSCLSCKNCKELMCKNKWRRVSNLKNKDL